MVNSDLHGWLEPKCGTKLTCMKVALIGGKGCQIGCIWC